MAGMNTPKAKPAGHTAWQAALAVVVVSAAWDWLAGSSIGSALISQIPEWQAVAACTAVIAAAASAIKGFIIDLCQRCRQSKTLAQYLRQIETDQ